MKVAVCLFRPREARSTSPPHLHSRLLPSHFEIAMAVHLHSRFASYHSSASMEADETSDSSRSSRSASASPSDEVPPPPVTKYSPPTGEGFTTRKGKDYRPPSTFYLKDPRKEMTASERLCYLATCPAEIHLVKDDRIDRGPMPTQSIFMENVFILSRALPPIIIQAISHWVFPSESSQVATFFFVSHETEISISLSTDFKWPSYLAYPLYHVSFVLFALSVVWRLNCGSPALSHLVRRRLTHFFHRGRLRLLRQVRDA